MSVDKHDERRRTRRSNIQSLSTTVEIGGKEVRAEVTDVSEGGMCLVLSDSMEFTPKETVKISIDNVVPSIRGKVRWVFDDPEITNQKMIGIQFESLEIRTSKQGDFETNLDLPIESPVSSDGMGRFLAVLEGIDHRIIDGKIEDLSEAAAAASSWIERTIGPLNVWYAIKEPGDTISVQAMVEGGHGDEKDLPKRMEKVKQVADVLGSIQFGEISYQFGDPLVLEFFCDLEDQEEVPEKIARAFGARIQKWSKLIIKNLALKFLGDELENRVVERTRELERGLRVSNEATLATTEFLSDVAHELRKPLNGILAVAQLLEKTFSGGTDAQQLEYVAEILTGVRHLLSLIGDILDLSSVESGKVKISLEEINLEGILAEAMRGFQVRAMEKQIGMETVLTPAMAGLKIMGDERLLKQVLFNLISNAIKFTPEGGSITLNADRKDGRVSIAVIDTGIGIAKKDLEKIFDRFYQVESTPAEKTPGVGIGLALSRIFVSLHGGKIEAASAGKGKGSRFSFDLPIKGTQPDAPEKE